MSEGRGFPQTSWKHLDLTWKQTLRSEPIGPSMLRPPEVRPADGPDLFRPAQTCSDLFRPADGPDLFRPVQTCSDLQTDQTCSDLSRPVQTCSDQVRPADGPDLFRPADGPDLSRPVQTWSDQVFGLLFLTEAGCRCCSSRSAETLEPSGRISGNRPVEAAGKTHIINHFIGVWWYERKSCTLTNEVSDFHQHF